MKPVVLVRLPNRPQFLGTFDTTNFKDWWKSEPLPGLVSEIVDNEWCYGQYHLAVAKMQDGTYHIFRSPDYGKTWVDVYTSASEIYTLTRIYYGYMLINNASGWYKSLDTGLHWSLVSTGAPGCKTVINIEENILVAHNGSYIFRSTDVGAHWTTVIDCHLMVVKDYHYGGNRTLYYPYDVYPALAGYNNKVLAGVGPYLLMSDDAGATWITHPSEIYGGWGWAIGCTAGASCIGIGTNNGASNWNMNNPSKRIIQIVGTKGSSNADANCFMIRAYIPYSNVVRHYFTNNSGWGSNARFDQPFTGYYNGKLDAYETMVQNTNTTSTIVFSSQSAWNPLTGGYNTSQKYSTDGGWTWNELDVNQYKVYEGDPDTSTAFTYGGPFIEENFTYQVWQGVPCHNSGKWVSSGYYRRGISLDNDLIVYHNPTINIKPDIVMKLVPDEDYTMDMVTYITKNTNVTMRPTMRTMLEHQYPTWGTIKANIAHSMPSELMLVQRRNYSIPYGMPLQKAFDFQDWNDVLILGPVESTYGMNIVLVAEHDWSVRFEKYMPQYPYMDFPQLDYDVLDTRKTPVLP
jgi:hypothetical protein